MISIQNLHVFYQTDRGSVHAVRGIDLDIKQGQFFTLLGPSGCGKTTTLRSVAGLETPQEGEIFVGDVTKGVLKFVRTQADSPTIRPVR